MSELAKKLALDALEEVRSWRGERFLAMHFDAVAEGLTKKVEEAEASNSLSDDFVGLLRAMAVKMFGEMPDLQQTDRGSPLVEAIAEEVKNAGLPDRSWWFEWDAASKVERMLLNQPSDQSDKAWDIAVKQAVIKDELMKAHGYA